MEDAGDAVSGVMGAGIIPSVLEILGKETLLAINENTDLALPVVDAMLLAETDGYTQAEADFQMEKLIKVFEDNRAVEVKKAESAEQTVELWKARKSAYAVLARSQAQLRAGRHHGAHEQGGPNADRGAGDRGPQQGADRLIRPCR
jgi:glycolate oxidase